MNKLFRIFRVDREEVQRLASGLNAPHHHDHRDSSWA